MFKPIYHKLFEKDIKRDKKSGKYTNEDFNLLKDVVIAICGNKPLYKTIKNHPLIGEWSGAFECHIRNDWILIYQKDEINKEVIFVRIGTHKQIFKKFK